ncbi:MAG: hypothetical protein HQL50_05200 [Magnetococcales bacterium]|nr:hypothetical protein [Magnetococcales bacterium]
MHGQNHHSHFHHHSPPVELPSPIILTIILAIAVVVELVLVIGLSERISPLAFEEPTIPLVLLIAAGLATIIYPFIWCRRTPTARIWLAWSLAAFGVIGLITLTVPLF